MVSKALVAASTKPVILAILFRGEDYGYQIIQRVKKISGGTLEWSDNMLYPVLHRMESDGLVVSKWRISESGRLRKYYSLTEAGRNELDAERSEWLNVHQTLTRLWDLLPARD